ncbi:MAG: ATP phosphoribosyltransferase regulatory subunit [Blautia massiliensis (ex Durand et al. 2017)]
MFGSADVLEKAKALTSQSRSTFWQWKRLEEIYEILKVYGCEKYIAFDFGMLSKFRYYTGIIFQAYTYGTGEPLIKGGRYNEH